MAENRKSISELTELPGNLSPNALLAIVQGGVTYHATGEQVSNMVLGNVSVVENSNGISVRFPQSRLQVAFLPLGLTSSMPSAAAGETSTFEWVFPEPFSNSDSVACIPTPVGTTATAQHRTASIVSLSSSSAEIAVRDRRTSGTATLTRCTAIAVGTY